MRLIGLEPTQPELPDPKSGASANFATGAYAGAKVALFSNTPPLRPIKSSQRVKNPLESPLQFHAVEQRGLRQQLEGMAVVDGRPELSNGGAVVGRGIALVLGPAILRELLIQLAHALVTVGLGENRCRCDAEHLAVALDDGGIGYRLIGGEAVAVDEDALGAHVELVQRAVHGQDARPQDIDAVNLLG